LVEIIYDPLQDIWDIFNCKKCGILFFYEEDVQYHLQKEHQEGKNSMEYESIQFIRVSQQRKENLDA